jgi:ATP-binding cassette subfamily B protein
MSSSSLALPDPFLFPAVAAAPSDGLTRLHSSLLGGEAVRAILTTDLNDELRAAQSIVMLTSHRLLTWRAATADTSAGALQAIDLHAGQSLVLHDHAGVATMELLAGEQRLAVWRFTLGANLWAQKLVLQFGLVQRELAAPEASRALAGVHGPLPEDDDDRDEVTSFAAEVEQPPSTWTLLRLWRFARPYQWQLLAGFLLMLASTAATLVPPYLTMPLMDDILIPFQNGKPIEQGVVLMYLGGLLASALLAWSLGWAKTYILALVSERIGADLRTKTYEHLMGLSLEYFGGKRTGDLMARIGSETDRINVFLSLHLLDFATDVLMILMTAGILFSINPWLALVTLVPLPFIAWLIHLVRDRLRTGFEKIDRVWAEVTNVLADTIPGIRVVKAFAQEKREAARFQGRKSATICKINDRAEQNLERYLHRL